MSTPPNTALVGPLPTVRFHDGTRLAADPPRNTLDPRYTTCVQHRTACDCREAELNETAAELRGEREWLERVTQEILAGHPTWADVTLADGRELDCSCMCTGCRIARRLHLRINLPRARAGERP